MNQPPTLDELMKRLGKTDQEIADEKAKCKAAFDAACKTVEQIGITFTEISGEDFWCDQCRTPCTTCGDCGDTRRNLNDDVYEFLTWWDKDAPDSATKLPIADAIVEILLNPPPISDLEDKKKQVIAGNTPLSHF